MVEVTVIMSIYNAELYIHEAITSILSQTYKNFEFIIIDDASTDNSLSIIKSFNDPRIKIIENKENIGLTKSLNKGLFYAKGKYIARQDADDVSLPNRLELQVNYLNGHSNVYIVGTSYYVIDEQGAIIEQRIAHPNPAKDLPIHNTLIHGSVMFRYILINNIGKYNEHFKFAQDYEFWLRISKIYDISNLPETLYKLRYLKSSVTAQNYIEQGLYVLKAHRMRNRFEIPNIEYSTLTPYEKSCLHNMAAYNLIQADKIELAKSEYLTAFKINPFNIEGLFGYIFSAMGKKYILWLHNLYRRTR